MRKYIGFLVIIASSLAFGQNTRVDGTAFSRSGLPAPGALVSVCSQPAITAISENGFTVTVTSTLNPPQGATVQIFDVTPSAYNGNFTVVTSSPTSYTFTHPLSGLLPGTVFGANVITGTTAAPTGPCAPVVGICASIADAACLVPNPVTADGLGNYFFYIPAGLYTYEIFGSVLTTKVLPDQNVGSPSAGSGFVNACSGTNCDAYFPVATVPSVFGDPLATDDGSGNKQAKSYRFTDNAHSGFWNEDAGPALPTLADLHSMYFSINPSFGTTYGLEPWDNIPTAGDCINVVAGDAPNWVKLHDTGNPCGSGGASPQIATPVQPTLSTNGTAQSASYSYAIVACEDGPTCTYHTAASSVATITTGNATLSNTNSINITAYGDTLYGPRCFNVYRTAVSGGSPSSTGLIANCVWKSFIDTGLAGNGVTAPNTNTTVLDPNGLTAPLPGCANPPKSPNGIDALPCSPKADDDEFTSTFGVPGDVNDPFWTQVNMAGVTQSLTNGMLTMSQTGTGADHVTCIFRATGSTPWTYTGVFYWNAVPQANFKGYIALRESATGKITTIGAFTQSTSNSGQVQVGYWNSPTSSNSFPAGGSTTSGMNPIYVQVQDTGSALNYNWSPDGVNYTNALTSTLTAFFTTAPNQWGFCIDAFGTGSMDVDYGRRTQ